MMEFNIYEQKTMTILLSLIVAFLTYKIKLIDDRKSLNFEKFIKYLQREGLVTEKNRTWEYEAWLNKDVRFELWEQYLKHKKDEGRKQALLDYYKDFKDNEVARRETFLLIVVNIIWLVTESWLKNYYNPTFISTLETIFIILSIGAFLNSSQHSLFNNRMLNPEKSKRIKKIYERVQEEIELDINKIIKKYDLEN